MDGEIEKHTHGHSHCIEIIPYITLTTCMGCVLCTIPCKLYYITRIRHRHHLHLTPSTSRSLTNKEVYMHVRETQTHAVNDTIRLDNEGSRLVMSCFPLAHIWSPFYFWKNEITSANGWTVTPLYPALSSPYLDEHTHTKFSPHTGHATTENMMGSI